MFNKKERLISGRSREKMMLLFSIVFMDFNIVNVAGNLTAVINTTSGPVQGAILSTAWHGLPYSAFKSIRFAEPPIDYLRFKPPVPAIPWTEIYEATAPAPECVQLNEETNDVTGDEDCLFLNVFTPETNLGKGPVVLRSVMVWIYGGAWVIGSSSSSEFSPDFLLERNVVVVSMNYRLGALGFLNLNHPNATGNAGLKDQRLALKWIQANIQNFAGNPNNVTIFGESAGAVSVGFHTLSESSAGLFHAAISMSGTPLVPWGFQTSREAQRRAQRLGTLLGATSRKKPALLQVFYNASAAKIVKATTKDGIAVYFTPTLENAAIATDVFLAQCSIDIYDSGKFNKVPQLLGFMKEETVTFVPYAKSIYGFVNSAVKLLREIGNKLPGLLEFFLDLVGDGVHDIEHAIIDFLVQESTDIAFISPIDLTQKILAKDNGGQPVYYYRNSFYTKDNLHNIEYNTTLLGAGHTDDIAEVFFIPYANYNLTANDSIVRSIEDVTTMWSNFAKHGNPTPDWIDDFTVNVTWPVSGESGVALNIGHNLTVVSRPIDFNVKFVEFYNDLFVKDIMGCR